MRWSMTPTVARRSCTRKVWEVRRWLARLKRSQAWAALLDLMT